MFNYYLVLTVLIFVFDVLMAIKLLAPLDIYVVYEDGITSPYKKGK